MQLTNVSLLELLLILYHLGKRLDTGKARSGTGRSPLVTGPAAGRKLSTLARIVRGVVMVKQSAEMRKRKGLYKTAPVPTK